MACDFPIFDEWLALVAAQGEAAAPAPSRPALVVCKHPLAGVGNRIRAMKAALFLAIATSRALYIPGDDAELQLLSPATFDWRVSGERSSDDVLAAAEYCAGAGNEPPAGAARILKNSRAARAMLSAEDLAAEEAPVLLLYGWNSDPMIFMSQNPHLGALVEAFGPRWDACAARWLFRAGAQVQAEHCEELRSREGASEPRSKLSILLRTGDRFERHYEPWLDHRRHGREPFCAAHGQELFGFEACAEGALAAFEDAGEPPVDVHIASDSAGAVDQLRELLLGNETTGRRIRAVHSAPHETRVHSGHVLDPVELRANASDHTWGPLRDAIAASRDAVVVLGTAGSSFSTLAMDLAGAGRSGGAVQRKGACKDAAWFDAQLAGVAPTDCRLPAVALAFRTSFSKSNQGFGIPFPLDRGPLVAYCRKVVGTFLAGRCPDGGEGAAPGTQGRQQWTSAPCPGGDARARGA